MFDAASSVAHMTGSKINRHEEKLAYARRNLGPDEILKPENTPKLKNEKQLRARLQEAYDWMEKAGSIGMKSPVAPAEQASFRRWMKGILDDAHLPDGDLDTSHGWILPKAFRKTIQRAAVKPELWDLIGEKILNHMWEDHEPYYDDYHDLGTDKHGFYSKLHQMGGYFSSSQEPLQYDDPKVCLLHLEPDDGVSFMLSYAAELQFFMVAEDLKKRDFSRITAVVCGT